MLTLENGVDLLGVNDLEVFLAGKPGGKVTIRVVLLNQDDIDAISEIWGHLATLYQTSQPSDADLDAWFESSVAPDYVFDGRSHTVELTAWKAGSGGPADPP